MPHDISGPDDGDAFGRVEQVGVEYIPESGRDSKPANLFAVFFGGNLAFSVIVFGWLPITFGLGFWAALASSAVGLTIGLLISAPLSLFGPRTGTNNTVSSGAHFGIRGRFIGSGLTLLFALAYAAIKIIRRIVGFAQVADFLAIEDPHRRALAQAGALTLARDLLLQPQRFADIGALVESVPRYEGAGLDPAVTRRL